MKLACLILYATHTISDRFATPKQQKHQIGRDTPYDRPLVLTFSCADVPGIVASVTGTLFEQGANVLEAQQFDDQETGRFFMRVVFDPGERMPRPCAPPLPRWRAPCDGVEPARHHAQAPRGADGLEVRPLPG
jgi:hypothetical protein